MFSTLLLQAQTAMPQPEPLCWGLKTVEWLTILAIVLGPVIAVLTQLWIQHRQNKKNQKLLVYGTLMSLRATWVHVDFVRAMNFVDVIFHKDKAIRDKRKDLMTHILAKRKDDGTFERIDWNRAEDLLAEMLDLMGKQLGYTFEHTQIKQTAYYPVAHGKLDELALTLREKGIAVLEGRSAIKIKIDGQPEV
jgi:hypothetical protein